MVWQAMPLLDGKGVSRAVGGAKLPCHSSALRQCESVLHFCWDGMSRVWWEAEHANTPNPCTTPQQKDCLMKKENLNGTQTLLT